MRNGDPAKAGSDEIERGPVDLSEEVMPEPIGDGSINAYPSPWIWEIHPGRKALSSSAVWAIWVLSGLSAFLLSAWGAVHDGAFPVRAIVWLALFALYVPWHGRFTDWLGRTRLVQTVSDEDLLTLAHKYRDNRITKLSWTIENLQNESDRELIGDLYHKYGSRSPYKHLWVPELRRLYGERVGQLEDEEEPGPEAAP